MMKPIRILASIACLSMASAACTSDSAAQQSEEPHISSLPLEVADFLRKKNRGGRGGCNESNIFIHGIHNLDVRFDRVLLLLGAPDYLCSSNSFISVIADSSGNWSVAEEFRDSSSNSKLLSGAPELFTYSKDFGFLLTTSWQIEGPGVFLYYSPDGINWSKVRLPDFEKKRSVDNCCTAPSIEKLCVSDSGTISFSIAGNGDYRASSFDKKSPSNTTWSLMQGQAVDPTCMQKEQREFLPPNLREKTNDHAIFDVSDEWAVRIPGATK